MLDDNGKRQRRNPCVGFLVLPLHETLTQSTLFSHWQKYNNVLERFSAEGRDWLLSHGDSLWLTFTKRKASVLYKLHCMKSTVSHPYQLGEGGVTSKIQVCKSQSMANLANRPFLRLWPQACYTNPILYLASVNLLHSSKATWQNRLWSQVGCFTSAFCSQTLPSLHQ